MAARIPRNTSRGERTIRKQVAVLRTCGDPVQRPSMYGVFELAVAAMLMRVGTSLYTCGMSRSKNAASAAMRALLDFAVATLGFWTLGAGVRFGFRWCL